MCDEKPQKNAEGKFHQDGQEKDRGKINPPHQ
jgi:hypothetical protein